MMAVLAHTMAPFIKEIWALALARR